MKNCSSCKIKKQINDFYRSSRSKDGRQTYCKECNKIWVRKRYQSNKKYYDQKNSDQRLRNQKFVREYLMNHPCVDCGFSNHIALEFDHKYRKRREISVMVRNQCSIESIEKEIKKCEVRCVNCHRIKTAKQLGWYEFLGE